MVRYRVRKGYLLIEVVIYILLAGIILISSMNIGIFIMKNYSKSREELAYVTSFLQIHDRVEKFIENSETDVFIKSDKRLELKRINDKKESFLYFHKGNIVLKDLDINETITIGEAKDMIIYENAEKNIFFIKYIFSDSYEVGVAYEK